MDFDEDLLDDGREEERRGSGREKNKERKKEEEQSRFDDESFIREKMKDPRIILYEELFKEKLSDEDVVVDLNMVLGPYLIKHPEGLLPDEVAAITAREKKMSDWINKMKEKYPPGTMVSFVSSKKKRKIHKGDMGTVIEVDDGGMIHVEWDDGSVVPLVDGVDILKVVYVPEKDEPSTTTSIESEDKKEVEEDKLDDSVNEEEAIDEIEPPDIEEVNENDMEEIGDDNIEEVEEDNEEEVEALTEEEMAEMNASLEDLYDNV